MNGKLILGLRLYFSSEKSSLNKSKQTEKNRACSTDLHVVKFGVRYDIRFKMFEITEKSPNLVIMGQRQGIRLLKTQ
jgi:hypothetical protein